MPKEVKTRDNREVPRPIFGGNGGGGLKFFEWKSLESRQWEAP
jgi:hypothetical protein